MALPTSGMGRILGLGFAFGAKDQGATKVTRDMASRFLALGESVEKVGKQSSSLQRFGNVMATLNFAQLTNVANSLDDLADKAGVGPGGQANQLEQFGVQFGKSYRQAAAGMGRFGKVLDKHKGAISGTAFTLDIDAEELTKGVGAIVRTGNALKDYGLSVRSVGGLMQSGILQGDQLADVLTSLSQGYGLGAKNSGLLLDEITAMAERAGFGADAIRKLPDAMKAADAAIQQLPENMRPSVSDTLKSLTALATSTAKVLGGTYEDAFTAATDVLEKLTESRVELSKTFSGLGGEFPELAQRLTEVSSSYGGVDKAFEAMMKDPALFVRELQSMYGTLTDTASQVRFLSQLPDSIKFMVTAGKQGAAAIDEMREPAKNFQGAMANMAKKASGSARTFAENMELLEDGFQNRLRRMTSQTDSDVLGRQRRAWASLGDRINELRKRGGPMAGFLQLALDVNRHGLQGLIPTLTKLSRGSGPLAGLAKRFREAIPWIDGMNIGAGEIIAFLGTAVVGFKTLSGAMGMFSGVAKSLGIGLGGLGVHLAVVAGLAYLVWENWGSLQPAFEETVKTLDDVLGPSFSDFGALLKDVAKITKEKAWKAARDLAGALADVSGEFRGGPAAMDEYNSSMALMPAAVGASAEALGKFATRLHVIGETYGLLATVPIRMGLAWEEMQQKAENAFSHVKGFILDFSQGTIGRVEVGFKELYSVLLGLPAKMYETIRATIAKLPKKLLEKIGFGWLASAEFGGKLDANIEKWNSASAAAHQEAVQRKNEIDQASRSIYQEANRGEAKLRDIQERREVERMHFEASLEDIKRRRIASDEKAEAAGERAFQRAMESEMPRAEQRGLAPSKKARRAAGARIEGARPASATAATPISLEGMDTETTAFASRAEAQLRAAVRDGMIEAQRKNGRKPLPAPADGVNRE